MRVESVELRRIRLPLVAPFRTSLGTERERDVLLVRVLGPNDAELRTQALAMDGVDPRIEWLVSQAPRWRNAT